MAFIQDISMMMRELLKVPKDYTPTAYEISKYIRSRYCADLSEGSGKRQTGSRRFSSASRSAPPRIFEQARNAQSPPQMQHKGKAIRLGTRQEKISGRNLSYSLTPNEKAKKLPVGRNQTTEAPPRVEKKRLSSAPSKKNLPKKKISANETWDHKPKTAPAEQKTPHRQSIWNWQTAKSHIRRAMSELVVPSAAPKNKLSMLSEQISLDPKIEIALASKKRGILKDMVDQDIIDREPLRTREIIQRLLEENKLEDQRREIARLTELARSKVLEARKISLAGTKNNRRRRDERL